MQVKIEHGELSIYERVLNVGRRSSAWIPRTDFTRLKIWGECGKPVQVKYTYPDGSSNWSDFNWDYPYFKETPMGEGIFAWINRERINEPRFKIDKTGEYARNWKSFMYHWHLGMDKPSCRVAIERVPGFASTTEWFDCRPPFSGVNCAFMK